MSRRDNRENRCIKCMMHASLCVCALIPRIETWTRLVLVIHRAEIRKPTNTGHLAAHALVNSEVHVRGREGEPSDLSDVLDPAKNGGRRPLLLYPYEDAEVLSPRHADAGPVALIVPDGNWRQAGKSRTRISGLKDVPCVTLPEGPPSVYRLRSEAHPAGLATIEAIARAMDVLEGARVRQALEAVFLAMVERTLWVRGSIDTHEVTGGIPEGASRHDPRRRLA